MKLAAVIKVAISLKKLMSFYRDHDEPREHLVFE